MSATRKKRGRPEHGPDSRSRKVVSELVLAGVPQDTVAKALGISGPTLRKHYRAEIDTASALAAGNLAGALYRRALKMEDGPAVAAAIFWLKTRAGWSEARAPKGGLSPIVK